MISAKMPRTKSNAAYNEAKDIAYIIHSINNKESAGIKIIESFKHKFGLEISEARERKGSSRSVHYDFDVHVDGVGWKHIEHKGSKKFTPIHQDDLPWKSGVQFHNGGCEKYSITLDYAKLWYTIHISSGSLKKIWNIEAPIPTFEEFWKDCRSQGDPLSEFQKELKRKVRSKHPKKSLLEERRPVIEQLVWDDKTIEILKNEVSTIANDILNEKDYWLTIHGDLTTNFHVAWYPKYTITNILQIDIIRKKDITFLLKFEGGLSFNPILRWGKGSGFSCLRLDLK